MTRAWLVPVENTGRYEVIRGQRPAGAAQILYTVRFRYDGETPAEGLEIVQRVPVGTHYVAGSATGPGAVVTFSVDDGKTFDIPDALVVVIGPAGESRPATADDYTHIRWELPGTFPAGLRGVVSFRARPIESEGDEGVEPAAPGGGR